MKKAFSRILLFIFVFSLFTIILAGCNKTTQLATPNITLKGSNLTWDAVENATSYIVFVNDIDYPIDTNAFDMTLFSETGDYRVQVMAISTNKKYSNSELSNPKTYIVSNDLSNRPKLSSPTGLNVRDGVLHFDSVLQATSYAIYYNNIEVALVTTPRYTLVFEQDGSFQITVVARGGSSYRSSDSSNPYYVDVVNLQVVKPKLLTPNNLYIREGVLRWSAVANAEGYIVKINDTEQPMTISNTHALSLETYGNIRVSVCAVGGAEFANSNYSEALYLPYVLDMPKNVRVLGNYIIWDENLDAEGYCVSINDVETITENTYMQIPTDINREMVLKVKCLGNDGLYADSAYSAEIVTEVINNNINRYYLDNPTNLTVANNMLSWDSVALASGYYVHINDNVYETTSTNYLLPVNTNVPYLVKVSAKGNGNYIGDSKGSNEIIVNSSVAEKTYITAPTDLIVENGILKWNSAFTASYHIGMVIDGVEEIINDIMISSYDLSQLSDGEHTIKLRFVASGLNSDQYIGLYSQAIVVNTPIKTTSRLDAPTNLRVLNGKVRWDTVQGANRYKLYINNKFIDDIVDNSYSLSNINDSGIYTFSVRAFSSMVEGSLSLMSEEITYRIYNGDSGTATNPFIINNVSDLMDINKNMSAYYKLGRDIDLSGSDFVTIGSPSLGFSGYLDGNGCSISNMQFSSTCVGLFYSITEDGQIVNLDFSGKITGTISTNASLLAFVNNGVVNNLDIAINESSINITSDNAIFGLAVGINYGTIVLNLNANIDLKIGNVTSAVIGGAIARNEGIAEINVFGVVDYTIALITDNAKLGVVIGENIGSATIQNTEGQRIDFSLTSGEGNQLVGLIAENRGSVNFAQLGIVGLSLDSQVGDIRVGGLVGDNSGAIRGVIDTLQITIKNDGNSIVGGIASENSNTISLVSINNMQITTRSYSNTTVAETSIIASGLVGGNSENINNSVVNNARIDVFSNVASIIVNGMVNINDELIENNIIQTLDINVEGSSRSLLINGIASVNETENTIKDNKLNVNMTSGNKDYTNVSYNGYVKENKSILKDNKLVVNMSFIQQQVTNLSMSIVDSNIGEFTGGEIEIVINAQVFNITDNSQVSALVINNSGSVRNIEIKTSTINFNRGAVATNDTDKVLSVGGIVVNNLTGGIINNIMVADSEIAISTTGHNILTSMIGINNVGELNNIRVLNSQINLASSNNNYYRFAGVAIDNSGVIANCYVMSNIQSTLAEASNLSSINGIAYNNRGSIDRAYGGLNIINLDGYACVNGFADVITENASIIDSYIIVNAEITNKAESINGFANSNHYNGLIKDSFVSGNIYGIANCNNYNFDIIGTNTNYILMNIDGLDIEQLDNTEQINNFANTLDSDKWAFPYIKGDSLLIEQAQTIKIDSNVGIIYNIYDLTDCLDVFKLSHLALLSAGDDKITVSADGTIKAEDNGITSLILSYPTIDGFTNYIINIEISNYVQLQGDGSQMNPYQITSAVQFDYIVAKPDAAYKLMDNIELENYSGLDNFEGVLYGCDKTITIKSVSESYTSLFNTLTNAMLERITIKYELTDISSGFSSISHNVIASTLNKVNVDITTPSIIGQNAIINLFVDSLDDKSIITNSYIKTNINVSNNGNVDITGFARTNAGSIFGSYTAGIITVEGASTLFTAIAKENNGDIKEVYSTVRITGKDNSLIINNLVFNNYDNVAKAIISGYVLSQNSQSGMMIINSNVGGVNSEIYVDETSIGVLSNETTIAQSNADLFTNNLEYFVHNNGYWTIKDADEQFPSTLLELKDSYTINIFEQDNLNIIFKEDVNYTTVFGNVQIQEDNEFIKITRQGYVKFKQLNGSTDINVVIGGNSYAVTIQSVADGIEGNGTQENPIMITTKEQLLASYRFDGFYKLKNDIDLVDSSIGTSEVAFGGNLDGNGFEINSVELDLSGKRSYGLFYGLDKATISNLKITEYKAYTSSALTNSVLFGLVAPSNSGNSILENIVISQVEYDIESSMYDSFTTAYTVASNTGKLTINMEIKNVKLTNNNSSQVFLLTNGDTVIESLNVNIATNDSFDVDYLGGKINILNLHTRLTGKVQDISVYDSTVAPPQVENIFLIPDNALVFKETQYNEVTLKPDGSIANMNTASDLNAVTEQTSIILSIGGVKVSYNFSLTITEKLEGTSGFVGGSGAIKDPFLINSFALFKLALINPTYAYKLTSDINLESLDCNVYPNIQITLDGNGYKLSNLKRTFNEQYTETDVVKKEYALIDTLSGTLTNIIIENAVLTVNVSKTGVTQEDYITISLLCSNMNASITNIIFNNATINVDSNINHTINGFASNNSVNSLTLDVTVNDNSENVTSVINGVGESSHSEATVNLKVNYTKAVNAIIGGINTVADNNTFRENTVKLTLTSAEKLTSLVVGGITVSASNSSFYGNDITFDITATATTSLIGGVIAEEILPKIESGDTSYLDYQMSIMGCIIKGVVNVLGDNITYGGVIGVAYDTGSLSIIGCIAAITLENEATFAGYIIGVYDITEIVSGVAENSIVQINKSVESINIKDIIGQNNITAGTSIFEKNVLLSDEQIKDASSYTDGELYIDGQSVDIWELYYTFNTNEYPSVKKHDFSESSLQSDGDMIQYN